MKAVSSSVRGGLRVCGKCAQPNDSDALFCKRCGTAFGTALKVKLPVARKEKLGFEKTCQKCRKRKPTTRSREIYLKGYTGPCGDSFCYASCDGHPCRPVSMTVCDECENKLKMSCVEIEQ